MPLYATKMLGATLQTVLVCLEPDVTGVFIHPAGQPLVLSRTIANLLINFDRSNREVVYPVCRGLPGKPLLLAGELARRMAASPP
jgi:CTP:molybdopterin cytidylyltransferase MocA